jgi:phage terminase large subunit
VTAAAAATSEIVHCVPYTPRKWAVPMHDTFKRWFAVVIHRRGGKTTSWLNHHQRAACDDAWERRRLLALEPGFSKTELSELLRMRVYAHILPSLTQARAVAWEPLKYISSGIPGIKVNERDMSITYPAERAGDLRVVRLWGADNIDGLRGIALSGLSLDEYSQHPPGVFGEVLSKALADHLGYCAFLGTIKGKNQLYKTYEASKGDPEWFSLWQDIDVTLRTETGATIRALRRAMEDDRALIAKGLMTQEEYDQEWYLSPHAAIKGAYYSKQIAAAYKEGRIRTVPYDPALPVYDVWDLGAGPNMSVGMFQRSGRQVALIDYLEGEASEGIPQIITTLKGKPYIWGKHFAPHDIKATDLSTGKTRWETAKNLGWPFEVVKDIGVDDGINAARLMLARTWIDESKCPQVLEALGQYRREWNERTGQFGDRPVHDWASHPADMLRYAAVAEDQMRVDGIKPRAPGRARERFEGRRGLRNTSTTDWMR